MPKTLRVGIITATLVSAMALAVIIGSNRLDSEVLAVLAGAVCGVGMAIPTSLLVVAVSRRRGQRPPRWQSP